MNKQHYKQQGFTLIELSIVLVIISLIVGGVIGGKSLIHASEIQSLVKFIKSHNTALNNFVLQYDALPGDMADATSYWPTAAGNGNGDNRFGETFLEAAYYWNHLGLSELIPGKYTGSATVVIGESYPPSPINGTYIQTFYSSPSAHFSTGCCSNGFSDRRNLFNIGKPSTVSTEWPREPFLMPKNAKAIDKKIDDGLPGNGKVYAFPHDNSATNCATSKSIAAMTTATYDVSITTTSCRLSFEANL